MKQQFINDTCMLFDRAFTGIDIDTVRNILTVALQDCEITKYSKAVTIYTGTPNEKVIDAFLVAKRVAGASNTTVKYYRFLLHQFFNRVQKQTYEVNANDVRIYLANRELNDGVSAVTRNNERRVLCSFFGWLADEELIEKNPMRKVTKIKIHKEKKKAFTQMELERIRANCKSVKECALVEIMISTGCRVSELVGIKLDDISGESVIVHGKGDKDRTVYLTAKAQLAINEYMASNMYKGTAYLFSGKDKNKPLSKHTVQTMTKRIGQDAGVSNCHPHRFRRTCATMALDRGMPIERVSMMLGHESIATTQVYLDLTEDELKTAHKKYVC